MAEPSDIDWASSAIGPMNSWPVELRSVLSSALSCPMAICVTFTEKMWLFYNDGYANILGSKHPSAMGRPFFDVYPEAEATLGERFRGIHANGTTVLDEELLVILERPTAEEAYFHFTGSPLMAMHSGARLGNLFIACEVTHEVKSRRRMVALRELTECVSTAHLALAADDGVAPSRLSATTEAAARACVQALAKTVKDVPFAALFLNPSKDKLLALLFDCCGVDRSHFVEQIDLNADSAVGEDARWGDLQGCLAGRVTSYTLRDLPQRIGSLTLKPWDRAPHTAHVHALTSRSDGRVLGALILGQNALVEPDFRNDSDYPYFVRDLVRNVTHALETATAIEEERRRLAELKALNEAQSSFVANVSHEFRTPLTLVLSPLEDLLAPDMVKTLPPRVIANLELMQKNTVRLLHLVNNLLDFSASESGCLPVTFECTDLLRFTRVILAQFEHQSCTAKLHLSFVPPSENAPPVEAYVDRRLWERVVVNLVSNAIKYTPANGNVVLNVEGTERGTVQLVVQDSGIGISEEALPHIFERFYRAKTDTEGTGIGLSLVQELVAAHGGTIVAESKLGSGSRFSVELPSGTAHLTERGRVVERAQSSELYEPSTVTKHAALVTTHHTSATHSTDIRLRISGSLAPSIYSVLIVDDNEQMLQYVGNVLSSASPPYRLRFARNGMEALRSLQQEGKPDLLLSDVMMPEMDGMTLLQQVRSDRALADLPVVLMSARGAEQSRLNGLVMGADDYLVKPFSSLELVARVRSVIELARSRQSLAVERQESLAKDHFVAVLSHELRNPLSAVLLLADLLLSDTQLPPAAREHARLIHTNVRAEAELIDDLLVCAEVSCNAVSLEIMEVDVSALLKKLAEAELNHKRINIDQRNLGTTVRALADPKRLAMVFKVLLRCLLSMAKMQIHVKVAAKAAVITVNLECDGEGMHSALLPRVFERFSLLTVPGERKEVVSLGDPLGVNLYSARALVQRMGGELVLNYDQSSCLCFTVTLPSVIAAAPLQPLPPASPKSKRAREDDDESEKSVKKPLTVLLVEGAKATSISLLTVNTDNPTTAAVMRRILSSRLNYDVRSAQSVSEALTTARNTHIDVLVSDIGLPDGSGWQLMEQLRKEQPHLVGIAVSGYSADKDIQQSARVGFIRHLSKPIGLVTVKEAMLEAASRLGK